MPRQLGLPAGSGAVPGDAAAAPRLEHDGPLRRRGRETRTRAPCRQPALTAFTLTAYTDSFPSLEHVIPSCDDWL